MFFRSILSQFWLNLQQPLIPCLEKLHGELSKKHKEVVTVLELIRIEEFIPKSSFFLGRPPQDRVCMARAFIAKVVLKLSYTKQLVEQLQIDSKLRIICGWEVGDIIPHESTFSRVFKEFAETNLPDRVHQELIKQIYQDKTIEHVGYDSTPINGREKPLKKEGTPKERKKKANQRYEREKKGLELSRKRKQLNQTLEQMIAELPTSCDFGAKKNSQGNMLTWKGYKIHAAVDDVGIAVAVVLTSASLNDCEAAIPLMAKTNELVVNFYDLMDSAYDVPEVKEYSRSLEHVPIIDFHARSKSEKEEKKKEAKRKRILNCYTAEDRRYKKRFAKERFNSLFKEYYGGRNIQYKGPKKVFCNVMFGVLACTAMTLLNLSI